MIDFTKTNGGGSTASSINTLFSVNSGNVNASGEGDLLDEAVYSNTSSDNSTYTNSDKVVRTGNTLTKMSGQSPTVSVTPLSTNKPPATGSSTWELGAKVHTPEGNTTYSFFFGWKHWGGWQDHVWFKHDAGTSGKPTAVIGVNTSGTSGTPWVASDNTFARNTDIYLKFEFTGTEYKFSYSWDKNTWTLFYSYTSTSLNAGEDLAFDASFTNDGTAVYLDELYYIKDGVEVWRAVEVVKVINSLPFKIGDTYPSMTATNGQNQQFTVDEAEALDLSQATDGNYTAFVTPDGAIYANKGTIYVQDSEPVMTTDDVWFDTSVYPYKAVQSDGTTEFEDVPFATFTIATQTNGSVLLTNPQTLPYNRFQVTTAQINAINTALAGKQVDLTTLTGYDATETQVLKNVSGVLTWITEGA